MVEVVDDPAEVSGAIAVVVGKAPRIDLVDDAVAPVGGNRGAERRLERCGHGPPVWRRHMVAVNPEPRATKRPWIRPYTPPPVTTSSSPVHARSGDTMGVERRAAPIAVAPAEASSADEARDARWDASK